MRRAASIIDVEPEHSFNEGTRSLVQRDRRALKEGARALSELGD
jgi:hypothetical protein